MVHLNKTVIGSDINQSEITDTLQKKGIKIYFQQKPENITKDIDLFIYSPAVPPNHPERQKAKEYKIPQLSYPEFLGILSKNYYTIAISGTHGKSTVTALTG
ncbi:MAG TPA: Mur ligase domain-containing protein [Candidatus Paceibacterota bacterium]|nr:Mur ligase domain-containing protein [Candidatus Paceibacterota bacterium]